MLDSTPSHLRMENKPTEKETFFQELFDLDEPDHSTSDVANLLYTLRASRPSLSRPSQNIRRLTHNSRQIRLFGRTVSAPIKSTTLPKASPAEPLHDKVKDSHTGRTASTISDGPTDGQSGLRSVANVDSKPAIEPLRMPTTNRKRKRGKSLDALPEAQQIFKGLRFCLLP